jgi:hypothetical protein
MEKREICQCQDQIKINLIEKMEKRFTKKQELYIVNPILPIEAKKESIKYGLRALRILDRPVRPQEGELPRIKTGR